MKEGHELYADGAGHRGRRTHDRSRAAGCSPCCGGGALAFVISRGIVRGVRQVVHAAEGIAVGDVNQTINVKGQ